MLTSFVAYENISMAVPELSYEEGGQFVLYFTTSFSTGGLYMCPQGPPVKLLMKFIY